MKCNLEGRLADESAQSLGKRREELSLLQYSRILKDNQIIYGKEYTKVQKRISYVVLYRDEELPKIAAVRYFVAEFASNEVFAVCHEMKRPAEWRLDMGHWKLSHIAKIDTYR